MANFNAISHLMVGALRHGNHGAVTDEAGWMPVATLVALPRFFILGADQQSIQDVIRTEHKKRFETEIRGGDLYIRVKQGWSLSSGVIMERALPDVPAAHLPDFLVHASFIHCLLYTSPSPRDRTRYRRPSSARKKTNIYVT